MRATTALALALLWLAACGKVGPLELPADDGTEREAPA
jgi:predicted small lipoprotein YifL